MKASTTTTKTKTGFNLTEQSKQQAAAASWLQQLKQLKQCLAHWTALGCSVTAERCCMIGHRSTRSTVDQPSCGLCGIVVFEVKAKGRGPLAAIQIFFLCSCSNMADQNERAFQKQFGVNLNRLNSGEARLHQKEDAPPLEKCWSRL
ncbi:GH12215 [Drosophila grimshawi]|uniref:GH12215 n=1 Tax=Drosophila grimshawi TaxID=7222 RepID=B4JJN4_DROGR|nr:GH12215 [Drosophila grimshawi]